MEFYDLCRVLGTVDRETKEWLGLQFNPRDVLVEISERLKNGQAEVVVQEIAGALERIDEEYALYERLWTLGRRIEALDLPYEIYGLWSKGDLRRKYEEARESADRIPTLEKEIESLEAVSSLFEEYQDLKDEAWQAEIRGRKVGYVTQQLEKVTPCLKEDKIEEARKILNGVRKRLGGEPR